METLKSATRATQVHPTTGQDITDTKLPAGTTYEIVARRTDVNGWHWIRISVDGFWYEVQCPYSHLFTDDCTHTANYEAE